MFLKITNQLTKSIHLSPLILLGLQLLALSSVVYGLAYLVRDLAFGFAFGVTLLALLISWWLASTRLHSIIGSVVLVCLGILLTFIWIGQLTGLTLAWLGTLIDLLRQNLQNQTPIDTLAFQAASGELELRLTTLFSDLGTWLHSLNSGNPITNYTSVVFFWSLIIWFTAAWAGWIQRRQAQPMLAIFPGGLVLMIALGYTYGNTQALLPFLFTTLLLIALNNYIVHQQSWRTREMDYPKQAHREIYPRLVGLCFGVMMAATIIPRISIPQIVERVQTWLSPQIEQVNPLFKSFGLDSDAAALGEIGTVLSGGLPRQHLIGSGPEFSEQVVMSVQVNEGLSETKLEQLAVPLYWRAITYDQYTGHGWQTSQVSLRDYAAEEPTKTREYNYHQTLQQDFQFVAENDFIYAAGEIISLNHDYSIAWRASSAMTETPETQADFFAGSTQAQAYQVYSVVPNASVVALRAASGVYPNWVSERYLKLPADLPERVYELARRLSRNTPTPYDKARAIEKYLRSYEYQLNLPAPPDHRDLADYFLFELRRGYCDYYATAMVVLARSIGLPARLAVGYTRGTYDATSRRFIVAEENAHSWAEIYFTGIGWVPFEPTAAQREISRPNQTVKRSPPALEQTIEEVSGPDGLQRGLPNQWWAWLVGFFACLMLLPWVWLWLDGRYLHWLSPSKAVEAVFMRLYHAGRRLGVPARVGETPYEFTTSLTNRIRLLAQWFGRADDFHPATDQIDHLSAVYARAFYSTTPLSSTEKDRLIAIWKQLRLKLLLARWLYFWRRRIK